MNRCACVLLALGSAHCGHVTIPVAPPITAPLPADMQRVLDILQQGDAYDASGALDVLAD